MYFILSSMIPINNSENDCSFSSKYLLNVLRFRLALFDSTFYSFEDNSLSEKKFTFCSNVCRENVAPLFRQVSIDYIRHMFIFDGNKL